MPPPHKGVARCGPECSLSNSGILVVERSRTEIPPDPSLQNRPVQPVIDKLSHYRRNPDYGSGIARRRIRLSDRAGVLTATLYDNFHEMIVEMRHDGESITGIAGAMPRFPKTTCPGAIGQLAQFVGARIADGREGLARKVSRSQHCTHLLDLAFLGLAMLQRGESERVFEVSVTDRDGVGRQEIAVSVDGTPALSFVTVGEVIEEPARWRNVALFGGFGRWASGNFAGLELDVWMVAQMAVLIAQGRAFLTDGQDPLPVSKGEHRRNACFSFSEPQFSQAWDCIGVVRDLTRGLPALDLSVPLRSTLE